MTSGCGLGLKGKWRSAPTLVLQEGAEGHVGGEPACDGQAGRLEAFRPGQGHVCLEGGLWFG